MSGADFPPHLKNGEGDHRVAMVEGYWHKEEIPLHHAAHGPPPQAMLGEEK